MDKAGSGTSEQHDDGEAKAPKAVVWDT
jgi:hypothetical protein